MRTSRRIFRPRVVVPLSLVALAAILWALPTPDDPAGSLVSRGGQPPLPSGRFVIHDVRLFDGEQVVERATVRIEEGRIAAIDRSGAATGPAAIPVLEGGGRTLLPGLIDAHTHSWGDALERAIVFGVTTQLDQFGDPLLGSAPGEAAAVPRAALFSAGTLVTHTGGHGTQFGRPIATLDRAAEAEAFVAARVAEGSRWIKLVIEDGQELGMPRRLPTLDAETVRAVVQAAHRQGVLAVAHVHALDAAVMAVEAGVDGLVHTVIDALPTPAFAATVARRGVFVVPTLSVLAANGLAGSGTAIAADPRLLPYLRRGEVAQLRGPDVLAVAGDDAAGMRSIARRSVRVWHDAGVRLLAGTDAANPGTTWGASLHGELELLVEAGLTPVESLAASTSRASDAFRLGDRGRIAVGQPADLLLVEGDPSRDITATRAVVGIWKEGVLVPRPLADTTSSLRLGADLERQAGVVADFDSPSGSASDDTAALPEGWGPTTDAMRGGASTVTLSLHDTGPDETVDAARATKRRHLRLSGEIRPGFPFPWAGAIWALGKPAMSPVDLGPRTELRLRSRGSAVHLMLLVQGLGRPISHPLPASADWQEHRVDLLSLGVPADAVTAILLCAGPALGEFSIEVDAVGLWVPPAA